jgi:DNA-binding Lrp family transcriptional regulator
VGGDSSLDWELYRRLFLQSDHPIWGMFPNPPIRELATGLRVTTNTVWRRLSRWREIGFLQGYIILPHPQLLGVGLSEFTITLSDPAVTAKLLAELERVNGVLVATHDVGSIVRVIVVAEGEEAQQRRKESIRRLPGVLSLGPTRKAWLPSCGGSLSENDWSLLSALRKSPEASAVELAGRTGLAPKTISRHVTRLRVSHTMLSLRLEDWSLFPEVIARFRLRLGPGIEVIDVTRQFRKLVPSSLQLARLDSSPNGPSRELAFLAPLTTVSTIDDTVQAALSIPGVARVETGFRVREHAYPNWIDERIELLRSTGGMATH